MKNVNLAQMSEFYQRSNEEGLMGLDDKLVIFIDLSVIDDRLERLRTLFPKDTMHAIPIKTNPLGFILRHIVSRGFGLEAASMEEVLLAVDAGLEASEIVFDSPAKTKQELIQLQERFSGIRINADSLDELNRYPVKSSGFRLGLRINPMIDPHSIESMNVGSISSKFGVPISLSDAIVTACCEWEDVDCLHLHIGSQVPSIRPMVEAVDKVVKLADRINSTAAYKKISTIDIGGGFPVNYENKNPYLIEDYVTELRQNCASLFDGSYKLITEFGRYVFANSGWALTSVEYVKRMPNGVTLITHAGADLFLRECYNPADWYHHIDVLDNSGRPRSEPKVATNVAGPLCFGGDFITRNRQLPNAKEGDLLAIRDIGANTFALWSRHCSRPFPKVIAYRSDLGGADIHIAKERESFATIREFWS